MLTLNKRKAARRSFWRLSPHAISRLELSSKTRTPPLIYRLSENPTSAGASACNDTLYVQAHLLSSRSMSTTNNQYEKIFPYGLGHVACYLVSSCLVDVHHRCWATSIGAMGRAVPLHVGAALSTVPSSDKNIAPRDLKFVQKRR
jgi:hypothetical protein